MRLRFWRWAHRRAEALWHWIYYNKLPQGKAERARAIVGQNRTYGYTFKYMTADGRECDPNIKVYRGGSNG